MPRAPGLEGLVVRRAGPGDHGHFCRTFEDESAYSGTLQLPFPSPDAWKKRLEGNGPDDYLLIATIDGEPAGNAGMHAASNSPRRAHARHIGMAVRSEFQGRGIGNALMEALVGLADNWLNVSRLELTVFTDNERAIALYRKHGFEIEGTHKAYALRAGRWADTYSMARVRFK
jgi:L-phenylalanine/L-methionine N-acetyltransferase